MGNNFFNWEEGDNINNSSLDYQEEYIDTMQVCENGHITNTSCNKMPEYNEKYCKICQAPTINKCQKCNAPIPGHHYISGVIGIAEKPTPPNGCTNCGNKFPWTDKSKERNVTQIQQIKGNKVFIIHGHDNEMKREVQLLLNNADLSDIVLHEQVNKGQTIIEKFIKESSEAVFAIALLSPDDMTKEGEFRARQNVLLEIGYFLGKLGREKVVLLVKGNIGIPSDLQGIMYINFDNDGAWKMKVIKEICAVEIDINLNKIIKKL